MGTPVDPFGGLSMPKLEASHPILWKSFDALKQSIEELKKTIDPAIRAVLLNTLENGFSIVEKIMEIDRGSLSKNQLSALVNVKSSLSKLSSSTITEENIDRFLKKTKKSFEILSKEP